MSENKKQSFIEKMKNTKISRATVITSVILAVAMIAAIAVTVAMNRTKDTPTPPVDTDPPQSGEPDSTEPPVENDETEPPADTTKPTGGNNSSVVQNKLPSFVLPVSGVLAAKHDPEVQVYSPTLNHYRVHLGVDIATEESAPVYAAADGKVSRIWNDELMGYSVAIQHSGNSYTIYQNLSETLAKGITEGASVHSGQLIASVGNSALTEVADEPHLHFEMTVADLSVDPLAYFSESDLATLKIDKVVD